MKFSIVIPVYNEERNILPLYNSIKKALKSLTYDLIFVDDGSTDGSVKEIKKLTDKKVRLIKLKRHCGKTTTLVRGFKEAKDIVDNLPKPLKEGVSKEDAEEIRSQLEASGATVSVE